MRFNRFGKDIHFDAKKFKVGCGIKPEKRGKKQLVQFVMDAKNFKIKDPLYLVYRGVKKLGNLEYDLTLIRNGFIGEEFIRTIGHEHPRRYGEFYEVLYGKAAFLIQPKDLSKFIITIAGPGQSVVIPPNCGHQTANIGRSPLLTGNLVYRWFKPDYSKYRKKRGGVYYLTRGMKLVKNQHYARHPEIVRKKALKKNIEELFTTKPQMVNKILRG